MGVAAVLRYVDDQARRLAVVEKTVNLVPQLEEAAVVMGDSGLRQVQLRRRLRIGPLGVVPDHEPPVLDLPGDQLEQVLDDDALTHADYPRLRSSVLVSALTALSIAVRCPDL